MKGKHIKIMVTLILSGMMVFNSTVYATVSDEKTEQTIAEESTQYEPANLENEPKEQTQEEGEQTATEDLEEKVEAELENETENIEGTEENLVDNQVEFETQEQQDNPNSITEEEGSEEKENSWRYENGERIFFDEAISTYSPIPAWSKHNGFFYNNRGEIIEGAIKKGIDVSAWQGEIDWNRVKNTDIEYAIIRCGYGMNISSQDDKYWKRNADECTRLGIPFGTYIYSYADSTERAKSEAEHVLRLVEGYKLDYPIYYDLEENSVRNSLSSYEIGQIAKVFCDTIEAAGYKVGIYSNTDWFTNYLTDSIFDSMNKWVAQYNSVCKYAGEYEMWQCTDAGQVDGISGTVDLNMDFGASNIPTTPAAATNLKASPCGTNQILISWDGVVGADGYLIYTTKNGKYSYLGQTEINEYRDRSALENQNNFYWVFSYVKDSSGSMYVSEPAGYVYAKGTNPVVPNIKAEAYGKNKVKLSWTAISGVDGYLIYGIKNGKYGYIGMTGSNSNSYIDTKALDKDYNYYWVFSYITDASGKILPGVADKYVYAKGICVAVTGLKAISVQGGVKLTWNKVLDADGYLIYGIVDGKKYSYVGMAKKGPGFIDSKASKTIYNYYWVFPYHTDENGNMIVGETGGETSQYTYGKAL